VTLHEGEYELKLVAADADHSAALPGGEGVVVLDTTVTPELAAEGVARDVVRVIQQARRDAGFDVSDRVTVVLDASDSVGAAVAAHEEFVSAETLANSVTKGDAGGAAFTGEAGDGETVRVLVQRA
jgi:isoleucyl-tRNA synthetase